MNNKLGVKVGGYVVMRSRFGGLAELFKERMREFNEELAESAAEEARKLVPVQTGALKATIKRTAVKGKSGVEQSVTAGDADAGVDYAADVELGGVFKAPKPYMIPAAARTAKKAGAKARAKKFYKGEEQVPFKVKVFRRK